LPMIELLDIAVVRQLVADLSGARKAPASSH
jgi:hypothetical protein